MPENSFFAAFYERYYRHVYRTCYMYMKDNAEAEDCTEDVFVKVLTGNYEFNDENHEKAWLTLTSINLCKDRLKSWWRRKTGPLEEAEFSSYNDTYGIESAEILKAVMNLPVKYKDVIYLHYYMGYKTEQISEILKKPPSTIRNHLMEARRKLKKDLGDDIYE
ncbi:MAG: RNA polymerase sigma factor [Lachnospiraceae bacterium]|nr:RNA polymerase sigma factor [Lachnospiraceae bacterium]